MRPLYSERFGNPSSVHRWGRAARAVLEEAREKVAAALGAQRSEIVFTSGGTESDNLALLGAVRAGRGQAVVAVSAIEHKAVLGAAHQAGRVGAQLCVVAVDQDGVIDLDALDQVIGRPVRAARAGSAAVVSIMWANNEVGTVQPVQDVAAHCAEAGALFHTDAVQAFGREIVRVDQVGCALLTISGHKIGALKGVGALYIRSGTEIAPLLHGGGQERELRPGTENIVAAVGLGVAAELAVREQHAEARRLRALRDELESSLRAEVPDLVVNGGKAQRVPHILNLSVPGVDQEALLVSTDLEGIALSSGSACQSGAVEPSHVLTAMNRARPDEASIRISLGRTTTLEEIVAAASKLPRIIERLRAMAIR